MVNNEKYVNLLKNIISCISYGDYYSVKELSNLELENMKLEEKKIEAEIKKIKIKEQKNTVLENLESSKLRELVEKYSKYIMNQVEQAKSISQLQKQIVSVDEFIKKLI